MGGSIQVGPLTLTGATSTLAGTSLAALQDGVGSDARFNQPYGSATDGTNLFVADVNAIRQVVIATGEVTTLARVPAYGIALSGTDLFVTDGISVISRVARPRSRNRAMSSSLPAPTKAVAGDAR